MKKIKVLVIDDSLLFQQILKKGLGSDDQICVVDVASDPFEARDKILEHNPDVITCDIEMPRMDGIEFIRRLLPQYKVPVIVVSSISTRVFDAMESGAFDFMIKPNTSSVSNVQTFLMDLIRKIKGSKSAQLVDKWGASLNVIENKDESYTYHKLIAIGASTGGTEAICSVLAQLPTNIPGIVIVQHIPPVFSTMFAERLNNQTKFSVKEASNNDYLESGCVYLAPGDKHMSIKNINGKIKIQLNEGEKLNGHCPSVDVLFNSVAKEVGAHAVGIILTGMGYDGAKGLALMKRKGAMTIGQDEKSSVVYGMPKAAYEIGGVVKQASLDLIGHNIMKYLR